MLLVAETALQKENALHARVVTSWQTAPAVFTVALCARNVRAKRSVKNAETMITCIMVSIVQDG